MPRISISNGVPSRCVVRRPKTFEERATLRPGERIAFDLAFELPRGEDLFAVDEQGWLRWGDDVSACRVAALSLSSARLICSGDDDPAQQPIGQPQTRTSQLVIARSEATKQSSVSPLKDSGLLPPSPFGLWRTRRFARNDDANLPSRDMTCPSYAPFFSRSRTGGRREGRAPAGAHGPRAAKSTRQNHRCSRDHPAFPARMVLRLIRDLLGDRRSCPRRPRARQSTASLASAPGGQDHTTSPSTSVALVAHDRSRPSQPASTFVTTRTPLR